VRDGAAGAERQDAAGRHDDAPAAAGRAPAAREADPAVDGRPQRAAGMGGISEIARRRAQRFLVRGQQ
jgi:hypothetical protein